jgi:hypothetical protein
MQSQIGAIYYKNEKEEINIKMDHNENTFGYSHMRDIYIEIKNQIDLKLSKLEKEMGFSNNKVASCD